MIGFRTGLARGVRAPRGRGLAVAIALVLLLAPSAGLAQTLPAADGADAVDADGRAGRTGVGFRVRGGAIHSLDAGLDAGGAFDTTRAVLEGSVRYAFGDARFLGLSVGYGWDGYDFSPAARPAGESPWDNVQTLRLSAPIFWEFGDRWRTLTIPIVRLTAEEASDWGQGLTGGGLFGLSYRFGERLRIGPGIGVLTEIGSDPTVFPVIVIDWQVTDRLRIETGRALGATEGPGLLASYALRPWFKASLGFRYEKLRFRLDDDPTAGGAIGQDESFPVLAGLALGYPFAEISLFAGSKFGGRLSVDDANGNTLSVTAYDPAFTLGGTFQLLF